MNTVRRRVGAFVSAVAATLLVGAPAVAAAPPPGNAPPDSAAPPIHRMPSTLLLSVNPGDNVRPDAQRVLLRCHPAGGDHPQPMKACARLASRGGHVSDLNARPDTPCVLRHAPVTVSAWGTWHGRLVRYQETFGNDCMLHAKTGAVFRF